MNKLLLIILCCLVLITVPVLPSAKVSILTTEDHQDDSDPDMPGPKEGDNDSVDP